MERMIMAAFLAAFVGALGCFITIVVRMFKVEGPGKGFLGLIFGPYAFVWGWLHMNQENLKPFVYLWTALLVIAFLVLPLALFVRT